MDLYKNILLKSVYVDLAIAVVVTVVLVVACVLLSKLFKKIEISKKINISIRWVAIGTTLWYN